MLPKWSLLLCNWIHKDWAEWHSARPEKIKIWMPELDKMANRRCIAAPNRLPLFGKSISTMYCSICIPCTRPDTVSFSAKTDVSWDVCMDEADCWNCWNTPVDKITVRKKISLTNLFPRNFVQNYCYKKAKNQNKGNIRQ